jgi:hypothetical protein
MEMRRLMAGVVHLNHDAEEPADLRTRRFWINSRVAAPTALSPVRPARPRHDPFRQRKGSPQGARELLPMQRKDFAGLFEAMLASRYANFGAEVKNLTAVSSGSYAAGC